MKKGSEESLRLKAIRALRAMANKLEAEANTFPQPGYYSECAVDNEDDRWFNTHESMADARRDALFMTHDKAADESLLEDEVTAYSWGVMVVVESVCIAETGPVCPVCTGRSWEFGTYEALDGIPSPTIDPNMDDYHTRECTREDD